MSSDHLSCFSVLGDALTRQQLLSLVRKVARQNSYLVGQK